MAVTSWFADYPDPISFLSLLDGRTIRQDENLNLAYFDEAAYNHRLDVADGLPSPARELALDRSSRPTRVVCRESRRTTDRAEGCRCGRSTYPARSTLDPLQGRRGSKVLVARNRLLKSTFRPRPRVAADTIVQSLSGDADALLDCYPKKTCKCRLFRKRLKGFEPSTFCMASSVWRTGLGSSVPSKGSCFWSRAAPGWCPGVRADLRQLEDRLRTGRKSAEQERTAEAGAGAARHGS